MILKNTLQDAFRYCEYYEPDCCKAIPCRSELKMAKWDAGIFMQKSHDFDFNDPLVVPGTYRVVQYRSPVPRALSNYELHLRNGVKDNIRNFRDFLVSEAVYFERFYKKWIANRSSGFFLLSYEQLTSDPLKAALEFFRYIAMPVDEDQVNRGVARSMRGRGRDNTAFVYQDVYAHRYANQPVLGNFEDIVIRNCHGYYPIQYFSAADSPGSLIGLLFNAERAIEAGDRALALSIVELVQKQDPEDNVLKRVLRLALAMDEGPAAANPPEDVGRRVEQPEGVAPQVPVTVPTGS